MRVCINQLQSLILPKFGQFKTIYELYLMGYDFSVIKKISKREIS